MSQHHRVIPQSPSGLDKTIIMVVQPLCARVVEAPFYGRANGQLVDCSLANRHPQITIIIEIDFESWEQ